MEAFDYLHEQPDLLKCRSRGEMMTAVRDKVSKFKKHECGTTLSLDFRCSYRYFSCSYRYFSCSYLGI